MFCLDLADAGPLTPSPASRPHRNQRRPCTVGTQDYPLPGPHLEQPGATALATGPDRQGHWPPPTFGTGVPPAIPLEFAAPSRHR